MESECDQLRGSLPAGSERLFPWYSCFAVFERKLSAHGLSLLGDVNSTESTRSDLLQQFVPTDLCSQSRGLRIRYQRRLARLDTESHSPAIPVRP